MNSVTTYQGVLISAGDEKIIRIFEPSIVTANYCRAAGITDLVGTHAAVR